MERFRHLLEHARASEPATAAERLREALALWRGPAVADLEGEPAHAAAAPLDELRLTALEERIDADLTLGRHTDLVPELEALTAEHPFRERLWGQLVLALYRAGRQASALTPTHERVDYSSTSSARSPARRSSSCTRAYFARTRRWEPAEAAAPSAPPQVRETRRTVTVVAGTFRQADAPDPEARRETLRRSSEASARTIARHGHAGVGCLRRALPRRLRRPPSARGRRAPRRPRRLRAVDGRHDPRRRSRHRHGGHGFSGTADALVSGAPLELADRLRSSARHGRRR